MLRMSPLTLLVTVLTAWLFAADKPSYQDPALTAKDRQHWSFVPPKRPTVPTVKNPAWVKNPIDAFVLAKLDAANSTPSPEADRITLIRRLTLDLHGLPPTPAEIDAFLADQAPNAYEKLVDRLLASPHYGERAGQLWLDVVRYAETDGYEVDARRPFAWHYRDYVISAMNNDKPYDRFVTEQLAGDILATGKNPRDATELHFAAGYLRCGPIHQVSGNIDVEENRQEALTEMVNNVGSAFLGLTVGCCRCHDHKFDPLSLGDYYRLQAFFAGTQFHQQSLMTEAEQMAFSEANSQIKARFNTLEKKFAGIDDPYKTRLRAERIAKLDPQTQKAFATPDRERTKEHKALIKAAEPTVKVLWDEVLAVMSPDDKTKRAPLIRELEKLEIEKAEASSTLLAWTVQEQKSTPETYILSRGDHKKKSLKVEPALPRITTPGVAKTRLDLARDLTRRDHPLTARVMVNRLWQQHFGQGLVRSANDFGTRGDAPTHPELLDWLAREFVAPTQGENLAKETAWTLKRMHRLMVTSATYRQASKPNADNKLLSHMPRRRLDAESLRDAILTASGTLNRQVGGRSVFVPLESEVYDLIFTEGEPIGLWPVTLQRQQHTRRSIYLHSKRTVRLPLFEAFDLPDSLSSCAGRGESTFAPQALILMNGPLMAEQSQAMAKSVTKEAGDKPRDQIQAIYRRALNRVPRPAEMSACLKFLQTESLADLCKVVLNTSEFLDIP
jgi:Protein of unknown function (DUF1549)/Protein of unknown function (DUF1553)